MILAGIDIGTNTFRLLVAETGPHTIREVHSQRIITRLGEGLDHSGMLHHDAMDRSLKALGSFRDDIAAHGATSVSAVGTSALRNAGNSAEFVSAVLHRTGIPIRIIPGEEEARLTVLGVMRGLPQLSHGPIVVMDIGGGSTEIISVDSALSSRETSVPLGAVYLTERYIRQDPPTPEEIRRMRQEIRKQLVAFPFELYDRARVTLVGTAGTITTFAAIDQQLERYDPERINGTRLPRHAIDDIVAKLASSTHDQRKTIAGLEHGREDIILAGGLVLQEIMELSGQESVLVSEWGLREGILADLYDKIISRRGSNQGTV